MYIVVGLAVGLILAGLLMAHFCKGLRGTLLPAIVYWVGVALIVIGLILLLTPVLIWINGHLQAMLGTDTAPRRTNL